MALPPCWTPWTLSHYLGPPSWLSSIAFYDYTTHFHGFSYACSYWEPERISSSSQGNCIRKAFHLSGSSDGFSCCIQARKACCKLGKKSFSHLCEPKDAFWVWHGPGRPGHIQERRCMGSVHALFWCGGEELKGQTLVSQLVFSFTFSPFQNSPPWPWSHS